MEYEKYSRELFCMGFSVIPCHAKQPLLAKGYRDKMLVGLNNPQPPSAWHLKNVGECDGAAVLCGGYSSGLLCLDFDLKNGDGEDFYTSYLALIRGSSVEDRLGHARTPSGGRHIWWKFTGKDRKSEKLARTPEGKDLIETRGTGGYALVPGSAGYEWIEGNWDTTGVLTEEETEWMLGLARCMDDYVDPEVEVYVPKGPPIEGDSPLNRYNAENSGGDWLTERGFRVIRDTSAQAHFNRPGAKNKHAVDATWYKDKNHVRIWSTSTGLVQNTDRNYTPAQLLVFTQYNENFSEAAKDLARKFNMPSIQKSEVRPVFKEEAKPKAHPRQEPGAVGPEIVSVVRLRNLEGWARKKVSGEVSLTEVLLDEAVDAYPDLEPDFVREFVRTYYKEHEDDFGEDNIKMPYLKAERFLKKNFIIRRNSVLLSTTILNQKGEETNLNDNSIWNMMQKAGIKVGQQQVKAMLNDPQYFQLYDPFVDYFQALGDMGKGHILKLSGYVVVNPEVKEFWESMFRKAMIRTVAGAIGGYPNREAIVLCSPQQNIGKTWFVRGLSPWGGGKYFSDETIVQHKDQMFRICQNMIYLIDEIGQRATNEKASDYLKMLISKQTVNERRMWESDTTNLSRKVTFWGSTNLPYLHPGENTRWISIPVQSINHNYNNYQTKIKEVDIDAVWSEAYQAYMNGEDFELSPEDREIQEFLNKDWVIGNEAMGLVDTYISPGAEGERWMSTEEVLTALVFANPNIVRRLNGRNLIEALRSRNIPHTYAQNEHGYKVHLFQCRVNNQPEWKGEKLPK